MLRFSDRPTQGYANCGLCRSLETPLAEQSRGFIPEGVELGEHGLLSPCEGKWEMGSSGTADLRSEAWRAGMGVETDVLCFAVSLGGPQA